MTPYFLFVKTLLNGDSLKMTLDIEMSLQLSDNL